MCSELISELFRSVVFLATKTVNFEKLVSILEKMGTEAIQRTGKNIFRLYYNSGFKYQFKKISATYLIS